MQIGPNFNTPNYRANNANLRKNTTPQQQPAFGKVTTSAQKKGGGFLSGLRQKFNDHVAKQDEITRQQRLRSDQLFKEGKIFRVSAYEK